MIAKCQGLALTPKGKVVFPKNPTVKTVPLRVRLTCDIDCAYRVRLERYPRGSTTLSARGKAEAGDTTLVRLPPRRVAAGRYRFTVTLTAPLNTGPPSELASKPLKLR